MLGNNIIKSKVMIKNNVCYIGSFSLTLCWSRNGRKLALIRNLSREKVRCYVNGFQL